MNEKCKIKSAKLLLILASLFLLLPIASVRAVCVASCPQGQTAVTQCAMPAQQGQLCSGVCYVADPTPESPGDCTSSCQLPTAQGVECAPVSGASGSGGGTKPQSSAPISLTNPLGTESIPELIGRVALGLTGIAGSLALLVFIWGGFQWLTASGNPEKIKKGRDVMLWAVLGLLVMFGSFVILRFVLQALTGATVK